MISGVLGAASGVCRSLEECDTGLPMATGNGRRRVRAEAPHSGTYFVECAAAPNRNEVLTPATMASTCQCGLPETGRQSPLNTVARNTYPYPRMIFCACQVLAR